MISSAPKFCTKNALIFQSLGLGTKLLNSAHPHTAHTWPLDGGFEIDPAAAGARLRLILLRTPAFFIRKLHAISITKNTPLLFSSLVPVENYEFANLARVSFHNTAIDNKKFWLVVFKVNKDVDVILRANVICMLADIEPIRCSFSRSFDLNCPRFTALGVSDNQIGSKCLSRRRGDDETSAYKFGGDQVNAKHPDLLGL